MIKNKCYNKYNIQPYFSNSYTLGDEFIWHNLKVKFIKCTKKGFNFLILETNTVLLDSPLYAKGFGGIQIPPNIKTFTFTRIPLALKKLVLNI